MEDMTRLALFEQYCKSSELFSKTLNKMRAYINCILENPHDYEFRNIKSELINTSLKVEEFADYLKYIGFVINGDIITYPKEQSLSKLRLALSAIERKLFYCFGTLSAVQTFIHNENDAKTEKLLPVNILTTKNSFLLRLQQMFNDMLMYEDEKLQAQARECMPLVSLQLKAIDRIRDHQLKLKNGEVKEDLSFDKALLMELVLWFKQSFFKWMDKPDCQKCGSKNTVLENTVTKLVENDLCRVELYKCSRCGNPGSFPRHNKPHLLLRTRAGRCGEWANCFTLLCRAVGLDVRYVYDVTDHVWCEVYDYESKKWVHVDPCEAQINAPLTYEHGWGKKLSYIIGVSRHEIQDVTWRYSSNHTAIRQRRNLCTESELISTMVLLREHRQKQVTEARRKFLNKRCIEELVELMVERQPSDYETQGRISGSKTWRTQRGEIGSKKHIFDLTEAGTYSIKYNTAANAYKITKDGDNVNVIKEWSDGVFECENLFRKEEADWRMVYLAREEDSPTGSVSWRVSANDGLIVTSIAICASTKLYENGSIEWTLQFDDKAPVVTKVNEIQKNIECRFKSVTISAKLSGGKGNVAWQHAQLFRQSMDAKNTMFEIVVNVKRN